MIVTHKRLQLWSTTFPKHQIKRINRNKNKRTKMALYRLPDRFRVSWREELQYRFLRWRPPWISNKNDFSYFWAYKSPRYFQWSFESTGLLVQDKKKFKIDFQHGCLGNPLGFLIRMILALYNFDLQVTLILPINFPVNWPFCLKAVQNRFSRWRPSWISD